jgi:SAM-dependent methyltransferase
MSGKVWIAVSFDVGGRRRGECAPITRCDRLRRNACPRLAYFLLPVSSPGQLFTMAQGFIGLQKRLSKRFDLLLPDHFRVDGNSDFIDRFARRWVAPGNVVYDIGGGKQPLLSPEEKTRLGLRIIGVDIDASELRSAAPGAYDEVCCTDITKFDGRGDADVVICQALLEHVSDVQAALANIATILKPGGRVLVFVPSRNAIFARLNLIIPQNLKRRMLFAIHPAARIEQGFPAFYDRCTPRQFKRMIRTMGLQVEEERLYYISSYFNFFAPLYVLWRLWMLSFFLFDRENSAETFSMVIRKPL